MSVRCTSSGCDATKFLEEPFSLSSFHLFRLADQMRKLVVMITLLQLCAVFQPQSAAIHGVIVSPNRQGASNAGKSNKADNADLSTASHNSMASPNPYTHSQQHPKYWDPNWVDYSGEQTNDERRLFNYLMRNYDTNIRPIMNSSQAINIRLGVTLAQIFDLDEKNQVLTTNIWLDQEWIDEFLTWNATDYGNITRIRVPCTAIWLPDLVLYNNADDYTRGYMCSRAIVSPSGNVFWPPPTKLRSTCEVDVTYFPFDDQTCKMKLGSWIYDGHQVNILNRTENVDLNNYVPNGEWDLIATKLVRNVVFYPCCLEPFPDVTITLVIRRKILYYLYNVILPCIMMSALTLLVFCLPPESGEKIALGVTVLLAFSVFMLAISEKLPETSESIPLLGAYLTVVMGITSVSIVMTVVVLNFHYISPLNRRPLPSWIRRLAIKESALCSGLTEPFDEFCSRYYDKARLSGAANCCPPSTHSFEGSTTAVNGHKLEHNHMSGRQCINRSTTTALDPKKHTRRVNNTTEAAAAAAATNETGNWFGSAFQSLPLSKRHQAQHNQQFDHQPPSSSVMFNNNGSSSNSNNNNNNSKRFSTKPKWMGQVDRLAASLFSGSGGGSSSANTNKVHSSELVHQQHRASAAAECSEALQRKASVAASANWAQSVGSAAAVFAGGGGGVLASGQTLLEKTLVATEAGYYHCPASAGRQRNTAAAAAAAPVNSSAVQDSRLQRPRTASSVPLAASSSIGGAFNRDQLQRSTMLSSITPYLLCAASRVVEPNQRQPALSTIAGDQIVNYSGLASTDKRKMQYCRSGQQQLQHSSSAYSHHHHSLGALDVELADDEAEEEEEEEEELNEDDYSDSLHYSDGLHYRRTNEFDQSAPSAAPLPPAPTSSNDAAEEVMVMLRYLMHRQETEDDCTRRIHEWRQLSMFIDKVLFWIFTIVTVLTSCIFLVFIPIMRRTAVV